MRPSGSAIGTDYYVSQGISTRARCPIYLGFKTHVLAIGAAIAQRREDDFYVTDLGNLFRCDALLSRSIRVEPSSGKVFRGSESGCFPDLSRHAGQEKRVKELPWRRVTAEVFSLLQRVADDALV